MSNLADKLNTMPAERRLYSLRELPWHLGEAGQTERLRKILTNFVFVEAKVTAQMVYDLVRDYQNAIVQSRPHRESDSERILREKLNEMPSGWKPVVEYGDRLEIAFWDREEFIAYVHYGQLFGPIFGSKVDKTIVWTTPSYSKFCYNLAYSAIERKAYYDALEALDIGLKLEPDHPLLLCERGLALNQLGQHEAAVEAYKQAFVARVWAPPSILAQALRGQAVALIDLDQLDEAEKLLNMSLRLEPENRAASHELMYIDQLRRGRSKATSGQIVSVPDELEAWYWFVDQNSHQIVQNPDLFRQYALNQPDDSPVYKDAVVQREKEPEIRIRWINKPTQTRKSPLQRTLAGHTETITTVAITPDSQCIVSGSLDKTLRIWNLNTGECLYVLQGHDASIRTVSVTSDGRKILSGDDQGVIRLWNTRTGQCDAVMKDHKGGVSSIVCLNDKRACSGGKDGVLRVWDLKTAKCIAKLEGDGHDIQRISVIPGGNILVSTSSSGDVRRWNLLNNSTEIIAQDVKPLLGNGIQVIGKGDRVAIVVAMEVKILDTQNGNCLNTIKCHSGSIKDLAVTPDGQRLITGGVDRVIQITQLETGEQIATLPGHTDCIFAVEVSPDGTHAVTGGGYENVLKVWNMDIGDGNELPSLSSGFMSGDARVESIALSPDGKYILSIHGGSYGSLLIRDASTGYLPRVIGDASQVYVDHSSKRILTVSLAGGVVQEWDLDQLRPLNAFSTGHEDIEAFAFSKEGDKCAFVVNERIEVIRLEDGQQIATLDVGEDLWIKALAISHDATQVVSLEGNAKIRVWEVRSGNCQILDALQRTSLDRMLLDADIDLTGGLVIAGDVKGTATVVDFLTGDEIFTATHNKAIATVAVDRTVGVAITGASDGTIRIWSLTHRKCIATFNAEGPITACSILPDNRILCGTMTGQVYLLKLEESITSDESGGVLR